MTLPKFSIDPVTPTPLSSCQVSSWLTTSYLVLPFRNCTTPSPILVSEYPNTFPFPPLPHYVELYGLVYLHISDYHYLSSMNTQLPPYFILDTDITSTGWCHHYIQQLSSPCDSKLIETYIPPSVDELKDVTCTIETTNAKWTRSLTAIRQWCKLCKTSQKSHWNIIKNIPTTIS